MRESYSPLQACNTGKFSSLWKRLKYGQVVIADGWTDGWIQYLIVCKEKKSYKPFFSNFWISHFSSCLQCEQTEETTTTRTGEARPDNRSCWAAWTREPKSRGHVRRSPRLEVGASSIILCRRVCSHLFPGRKSIDRRRGWRKQQRGRDPLGRQRFTLIHSIDDAAFGAGTVAINRSQF